MRRVTHKGRVHRLDSDGKVYLTPTERRSLVAAANGLSARAAAQLYGISEQTIKSQRKLAAAKLDARNITDAVTKAWRACILTGDDITGGPIPLERA